ncbi:hypothetical protein NA57DRAFT_61574 [Rhizodiscina lignyota]|uniref:Uncharacterized protein n=1 Tax=Rhizodiscina lignyota TaxID=1504668 RepID=A0A9P4M540_9PEZI|nr:hypothetical protein NA57DRAFT_61574 [Rhizodiscina lignyota]
MPRAKRSLADADPNASSSPAEAQQTPKRTKTAGKENEAAHLISEQIIEKIVEKYNARALAAQPGKKGSEAPGISADDLDALKNDLVDAMDPTNSGEQWYFYWQQRHGYACNLKWCFDRERELDEDEMDNYLRDKDTLKAEAEEYNKKPADDFPGYKWIISTIADALWTNMQLAEQKCNPDIMSMYIYNDFYGYGVQEIIENALVAWNDEYSKKDGERMCRTLYLLGLALLETLHQMERAGLLADGAKAVRNVPLVLALWFSGLMEHTATKSTVERWGESKAGKKGKDLVYRAPNAKDVGGKFGFQAKWKRFMTSYGRTVRGKKTVGGNQFDITKMSTAERKKHSYNNTDPLAKMGQIPAPLTVPWGDM